MNQSTYYQKTSMQPSSANVTNSQQSFTITVAPAGLENLNSWIITLRLGITKNYNGIGSAPFCQQDSGMVVNILSLFSSIKASIGSEQIITSSSNALMNNRKYWRKSLNQNSCVKSYLGNVGNAVNGVYTLVQNNPILSDFSNGGNNIASGVNCGYGDFRQATSVNQVLAYLQAQPLQNGTETQNVDITFALSDIFRDSVFSQTVPFHLTQQMRLEFVVNQQSQFLQLFNAQFQMLGSYPAIGDINLPVYPSHMYQSVSDVSGPANNISSIQTQVVSFMLARKSPYMQAQLYTIEPLLGDYSEYHSNTLNTFQIPISQRALTLDSILISIQNLQNIQLYPGWPNVLSSTGLPALLNGIPLQEYNNGIYPNSIQQFDQLHNGQILKIQIDNKLIVDLQSLQDLYQYMLDTPATNQIDTLHNHLNILQNGIVEIPLDMMLDYRQTKYLNIQLGSKSQNAQVNIVVKYQARYLCGPNLFMLDNEHAVK